MAVGVFDGMHPGHRALLARALERAAGELTVALSFEPHPDVVLAREFRPYAPLTPLPEKQVRIERMGIELRVLPFTRELAALEPDVFVERHLVSPFALRWLVVGEDFALGRARAGNVARLRELGERFGFEVDALPLHRPMERPSPARASVHCWPRAVSPRPHGCSAARMASPRSSSAATGSGARSGSRPRTCGSTTSSKCPRTASMRCGHGSRASASGAWER